MTHRWAAIEVSVAGDAQEIVGAILTEVAGCQGYAATATAVTGYLPVDDRLENTLITLRQALSEEFGSPPGGENSTRTQPSGREGDLPLELTIRFVEEEDWANAWKQYFKPHRVGKRFVIKPTWETFAAEPNDLVVQIDPGMAFGTGLHATTRLCLQALEDVIVPGASVADVGTGSGILAIGAILLGATSVMATDNDPLAVRIAQENIAVNGMADRITVKEASLPPTGPFAVVVANILADIIIGMSEELFVATRPGGTLIVSGIIETKADAVRRSLEKVGYTPAETRTEGEWVALVTRRPA